jgi:hypothetical protein
LPEPFSPKTIVSCGLNSISWSAARALTPLTPESLSMVSGERLATCASPIASGSTGSTSASESPFSPS